MRALGYCRPDAPDFQAERFGGLFEEFCDANLHQPLQTFVELGGGTEQFASMLEYIRGSGSEFLTVVPDARHLGRDLEAVARSLVDIESTGSTVTCMDDEFPDPVQNAFQRLGIKGVSRTRSLRVSEAMRRRASQGKALGRPLFGYRIGDDGTLQVVPEQAAVVELIYRLYTSDGLGYRLIAQHLNERGITTRRGSPWNVVTVRDVLRNPVYTGTYNRFGMRLPRVHEAIIAPATYRQAQDRMRARRPIGRVSKSEPFLLSGLVTCAGCGNNMMGVTRRQKWKRKDGRRASGVYRYYQCQSRQNQGRCEYRTWRASLLESTVISQLRDRIARSLLEARLDAEGDSERLAQVRRRREDRVEAAERRLVSALRRVARAEIPLYLLEDYLRELDSLRRQAARGDEAGPSGALARLGAEPAPGFDELRSLIEDNVERIMVRDEGVEVHI